MTQHQGIGAYFSYFNLAYTKNMSALSGKTFNLFLHKKGDALPDLVSLTIDKAKRYQVQFKKERGNDLNILVANHTKSTYPTLDSSGQYSQALSFVLSPNTTYEVYISSKTEISEAVGDITTISRLADAPTIVSAEGAERINAAVSEGVDIFLIDNYQLLFPMLQREAFTSIASFRLQTKTSAIYFEPCAGFNCPLPDNKTSFIFSSNERLIYLFAHYTAESSKTSKYYYKLNEGEMRGIDFVSTTALGIRLRSSGVQSKATKPPAAISITKNTASSTDTTLAIAWTAGLLTGAHLSYTGEVLIPAQLSYRAYLVAKVSDSTRTAAQVKTDATQGVSATSGQLELTIDSLTAATAYEIVIETINITDIDFKSLSAVFVLSTN